ncbi:MAG: diguanylate cyclase [Planctomycetota bacterium]|jgi:diguanylate cyclase (GGDEF)-like protein
MTTDGTNLVQRILVVDDIDVNRMILDKALTKAGYEVLLASNGRDAEAIAATKRPGVILLDMMMPDRDGLETCRALKNNPETCAIPIIFVTAESPTSRIEDAFDVGGADYITKPFHIDEILARVAVQLRLRATERELIEKKISTENLARELAETNARLAEQARLDPLTELLNRRAWEEAAHRERKIAIRKNEPFGILMLDVDYFKLFNDTQGHPAGDECLRQIAETLASECRSSDLIGRYGGEEFVVFSPDADASGAANLAERIRTAIAKRSVSHPSSPISNWVTASVGVSVGGEESLEQLLQEADNALYDAKRNGRNCIWLSDAAQRKLDSPTFELPAIAETSVGMDRSRSNRTVLIADSDRTAAKHYVEALRSEGYQIHVAWDGPSVLAEAQSTPPDVMVLSASLPKLSGTQCTNLLKTDFATKDIPVILIRNQSQEHGLAACLDAGADECIPSPVDDVELSLRVRSMCRQADQHRALVQSYQMRGEQSRILSLLLDFCRSLSNSDELDAMLDAVIKATVEITSSRHISILVTDAAEENLTVARCEGIGERNVDDVILPINEGVSGWVISRGQRFIFDDLSEGGATMTPTEASLFGQRPVVAVPLGAGSQLCGVINVAHLCGSRNLDTLELESLELLAVVAGSAIHSVISTRARDEARDSIMKALATLAEKRDMETGKHLERVTRYCVMLARTLQKHDAFSPVIDDRFLHNLERAVPLHDIGKVAIPDKILNKRGRFNEAETEIMRTHASIGAQTIRALAESTPGATFLNMAEQIARYHHAWYNGSDPDSDLAGQSIPLCARIAAVADVYDALRSERCYKKALDHQESMSLIVQGSGTQFDPAIVEAFLANEKGFARLARELADTEEDFTDSPSPLPAPVGQGAPRL